MFVILAAGKGTRFEDGTNVDKALRLYKGRPLIDHALDRSPNDKTGTLVIGTPAVTEHVGKRAKTITVEHTQRGPAASGLLASALIRPLERVAFMDCDTIIAHEDVYRFYDQLTRHETAVAVSRASESGKYCRVTVDEDGYIDMMEERAELTHGEDEFVTVGLYGFQRFGVFYRETIGAMWKCPSKEIYMSTVIEEQPFTMAVPIMASSWIPVGDPESLERANES